MNWRGQRSAGAKAAGRAPVAVTALVAAALVLVGAAGAARAAAPPAPPVPLVDDEFERIYEQAQSLFKAGDHAAALAAYERAYAIRPQPEPLYGIARCHHRLGGIDEAALYYEKFLAAAPAHPGAPKTRDHLVEALGAIGARALARTDLTEATRAYRRALALHDAMDPARTDAISGALLVGLGEALVASGAAEEAAPILEAAARARLTPELQARLERARRGPSPSPPRKRSLARWLGAGAGAAVVAGALAIVVVLVLPRPLPADTDLGVFEVRLSYGR